MSNFVDYEKLRRAISIEQVAAWLGLELKKNGDQYRTACPLHEGGDRSLVITPSKQQFFCFAPGGKSGGGSLELIAHVHGISLREAALALEQHLYPKGELKELEYLQPEHDEVQKLGIPAHQAQALGIG